MSEDLLEKFIASIDEEDGLFVRKKEKEAPNAAKGFAKKLLSAAARGQVELPDDETYLVEKKTKKRVKRSQLNDKWASQGFSLVEQIRSEKPVDLAKRNLKYAKYTEKRKLDSNKMSKMLNSHMSKQRDGHLVRSEREKINCMREKSTTKKTSGSVFSEEDFKRMQTKPKKLTGSF